MSDEKIVEKKKIIKRKKDVNYFDLFIESAKVANKAAIMLGEMINGSSDDFAKMSDEIHEVEHEGDELYHTLYDHLNRSFITPIEREDILEIARNIEQTTDAIDEVAITMNLLLATNVRPVAVKLSNLITESTGVLLKATEEFKNYKKSKKLPVYLVEINNIEEKGDKVYQNAIKDLFSTETNPIEVIKWKEIYDKLENVLDACENITDGMEAVIVKNS